MADFITLVQTFGLPLASYLVAVAVLSKVIVSISREKDRISDSRYDDMKKQFEARLVEQRQQYESRLQALEGDRDWNRDRLHQALGVTDAGTATVEELVRRLKQPQQQHQLPRRGD